MNKLYNFLFLIIRGLVLRMHFPEDEMEKQGMKDKMKLMMRDRY